MNEAACPCVCTLSTNLAIRSSSLTGAVCVCHAAFVGSTPRVFVGGAPRVFVAAGGASRASSCENSLTSLRRVWVCVCVCVERGMSPLTHAPYLCRTNGRERVLAMTHKSTGYDTPRVLPMTRLECWL